MPPVTPLRAIPESDSGNLTGTPTAAGTYTFTVRVQDGSRSDSKQLTIAVRSPLAITHQRSRLKKWAWELIRAAQTRRHGRHGSVLVEDRAGTLPDGLGFDPATAEIKGTPMAAGSFPVKLSATDTERRTATASVTLTVKSVLTVGTRRLPVARSGRSYNASLLTLDGVGPVTWRVVAGRFPIGVRLNRANGAVTGRPGTRGYTDSPSKRSTRSA